MPRLWSACFTLGCSIGWLSVTVVTLVRVFSCSRYVGGSLFPVPGCGLVLLLVDMLVGMLDSPVCGVWLLCGSSGSFGGYVLG